MKEIGFLVSPDLTNALSIAEAIAKEYNNNSILPGHLLKALLHQDIGLRGLLENAGLDLFYLDEWADVRIESYPKSSKLLDQLEAASALANVIDEANNVRIKMTRETIDPQCAMAALCKADVGFTAEQLKTVPVSEIVNNLFNGNQSPLLDGKQLNQTMAVSPKGLVNLQKYCLNITEKARLGEFEPVIAREREIRMITEVLGRRSKPNVILVGEAGVGKTAVVNGLVKTLINNQLGKNFEGAIVFELDPGTLIAGASYKGEIEDRLKKIFQDLKQLEKAILFIDDIHVLFDKQGSAAGASGILKPELAKGEITLIGITTIDNYTRFIEVDESIKNCFETIKIEEPDEISAAKMVTGIISGYEKHHAIKVPAEVIDETIRLSKRYLKERALPDSAIDLLDRTMAAIKVIKTSSAVNIPLLKEQLSQIKFNQACLTEDALRKELSWFNISLRNTLSEVLFSFIDKEQNILSFEKNAEIISSLEETLLKLEEFAKQPHDSLEKQDVASVVAQKTGIPLGKLQSQERDRLLRAEDFLRQRVVGQDHAIKSISEAILESRSGLNKPGQPIGSFFFLGPTGTGKTELAKSLAEFLFQDDSALIRFDMSEFKEEHSAALLYGAPPGYVGYEEGGLLVNKIRQRPYAVVLFDEIEKAHKSVFDIFLQILDEGKLHDRLGKEGDFSNALVLFTSNIASQVIVESFNKGEIPKSSEIIEIMADYFRPEFLGRLTEVVPFAPISKALVVKIFDIHLKGLYKTLEMQGIRLVIEEGAKEKLALDGFSPKYGARPLIGAIRNSLRRPLSRMIIRGEIVNGNTIRVGINENKELTWDIS